MRKLFEYVAPATLLKAVGILFAVLLVYYLAGSTIDKAKMWLYGARLQKLERQVEEKQAEIEATKEQERELSRSIAAERARAAAAKVEVARKEAEVQTLTARLKDTEARLKQIKEDAARVPAIELPARIRVVLGRLYPVPIAPNPSPSR